jgi:hypothetical protein
MNDGLTRIQEHYTSISHRHVKDSVKEVWEKLQNTYEDEGLTRRLSLLRKLFRVQLSDCSSMEGYLNEILSLAQRLDAIDAGMSGEFIGVIMLNGLSDDYDPMIMAMESSGVKITSDYVRTMLLQQDAKQKGPDDAAKESALLIKSKGNKFPPKPIICYKCNKEGHKSFHCPKKE